MPLNPIVARRYAGALYQLTNDKTATVYYGKASQVLVELNTFLSALQSLDVGFEFFLNPVISREDKILAIADLESRLPLTYKFLVAVIEGARMEYLKDIVSEFQRKCEEALGELTVDVEFAHEPTASTLEEIRATLNTEWKRKIKIKSSINPNILGGFVAKSPGRVMDVSVASQLDALEQQLIA